MKITLIMQKISFNMNLTSSSGEITRSVRVTKNPLEVKDKVKCRLAGIETWIESEIVSKGEKRTYASHVV